MAIGFEFDSSGVSQFKQFLNPQVWKGNLNRELKKATLRSALYLVRNVKRAINQRKYGENAQMTLALKNSNLPLLDQRNLWRAIDHRLTSSLSAEIGIIRDGTSTGSRVGKKGKQISLTKLVELMESGYTIKVTEKMKRAIAIALAKRDGESTTPDGDNDTSPKSSASKFQAGQTYIVPPRPIFTAIWNDPETQRIIQENWRLALESAFLAQGARDGEHKNKGGTLSIKPGKATKKAMKASSRGLKRASKSAKKFSKKAGKVTKKGYKAAKKGVKSVKRALKKKFRGR